MTLVWKLERIVGYETRCYIVSPVDSDHVVLHPNTNALIWATPAVGLGEIADNNVYEFFARYTVYCKINGLEAVSFEVVKAHIGLKTNVYPNETRAQWAKRTITGPYGKMQELIKIEETLEEFRERNAERLE